MAAAPAAQARSARRVRHSTSSRRRQGIFTLPDAAARGHGRMSGSLGRPTSGFFPADRETPWEGDHAMRMSREETLRALRHEETSRPPFDAIGSSAYGEVGQLVRSLDL